MFTLDRLACLRVLALALAATLAGVPACSTPKSVVRDERLAVVGASTSAGFNASLERDGGPVRVRLADALSALQRADAADPIGWRITSIASNASELYFLSPVKAGTDQLKLALASSPTIIIAVDDLFWHVYGPAKDDQQRLTRLEKRLTIWTETLDASKGALSLVIGDIPDMSHATQMLSPRQIAPRSAIDAANTRIAAWAQGRTDVAVLPLKTLAEGLLAKRVRIGTETLEGAAAAELLGPDDLHPTWKGEAALAIQVASTIDTLDRRRTGRNTPRPLPTFEAVSQSLKAGPSIPPTPAATERGVGDPKADR